MPKQRFSAHRDREEIFRDLELPKGVREILQNFSGPRDPRVTGNYEYPFETVLLIGLMGVLCGAAGWTELEVFAKCKKRPWS